MAAISGWGIFVGPNVIIVRPLFADIAYTFALECKAWMRATSPAARELMARRIIDLGQRGERDRKRLIDEALLTLTQRK